MGRFGTIYRLVGAVALLGAVRAKVGEDAAQHCAQRADSSGIEASSLLTHRSAQRSTPQYSTKRSPSTSREHLNSSALIEGIDCVKCPSCLQKFHSECLHHEVDFVRKHKDCIDKANALCSRGVWECPNTGIFFTHPTVSPGEISSLYKNAYTGQMVIQDANNPRIQGQFAYIDKHILSNPNVMPKKLKTVVEIGCAAGFLSTKLASADRRMICFEPDPDYANVARKHLEQAGFSHVDVINGPWDASKIPADGIDLFVSSHVLEHSADLCELLRSIYSKMNLGGVIFSEVPNHTREYILTEFGGQFHLSFPTEEGFLKLMKASQFEMVSMDLFAAIGDEFNTKGTGAHIRSVFRKPGKHEHGGLGWTPAAASRP